VRRFIDVFSLSTPPPHTPPLFPYTTLFRSATRADAAQMVATLLRPALAGLGLTWDPASAAALADAASLPALPDPGDPGSSAADRSEEHTSELQSRFDLVCRLLLEKKKYTP